MMMLLRMMTTRRRRRHDGRLMGDCDDDSCLLAMMTYDDISCRSWYWQITLDDNGVRCHRRHHPHHPPDHHHPAHLRAGNIYNTERRGRARGRGAGPAREPVVVARDGAPAAMDDDGEVSLKEPSSLAPARRSERPKRGGVTFKTSFASEPTVAFTTASAGRGSRA